MTITLTEFEAMDLRLALYAAAAQLNNVVEEGRGSQALTTTAQECSDLADYLFALSQRSRRVPCASSLEGRE